MNRIANTVAIIGALAAATPALAQTKQQIAWCNGKDGATPQQMFAGCDAGIKSGKYKGAQLAPFVLNRGRALSDLGDKDKAMADYNQGLKLSPKDLSGLLNRSNIHSERGEFDKAQADLDRAIAIAINAKFTLGYYNRGTLFHKMKDYKRAVDDFTVVIKNAPKFGPAYNNRSSAYTSLKQYDKAIAEYDIALKEKGYAEGKPAPDDSAEYLYQRGVVRIRAGDALGGAKDIAAANPDTVEFYSRYGI